MSLCVFADHPTDFYHYNSRIFLNPQVFQLRLKTLNPRPSTLVGSEKLNGPLGGLEAGYEYKKLDGLYTSMRGSFALGRIERNTLSRFVHEWIGEARFGYNYVAMQGVKLIATFYTGYGFQNQIYSQSSGNGFSPIKLSYLKYYLPVGLLLDYKVADFFHFLFDFAWLPDMDPTVKIGGISASRQELKHKSTFRVLIPLRFFLGDTNQGEISLIPFWKRQIDGRTRQSFIGATSISIPEQVLMYWGGQIAFGYHF